MFFGTRHWFKFLYFITAMSPAYILYSLHLYAHNEIEVFNFSIYRIPILTVGLLLVFVLLVIILKKILKVVTKDNENPHDINGVYTKIIDQNGNSIVFLLSVIIPSVIYIEASIIINIIIFFFIQYMLFILMNNSTILFPNILLIIFGIHTFKLKDGKYLISDQAFMKSDANIIKATSIGDHSNTLCFVKGRE